MFPFASPFTGVLLAFPLAYWLFYVFCVICHVVIYIWAHGLFLSDIFSVFVFVAAISVVVAVDVVVGTVVVVVVVLSLVLPFQHCLFRHLACVINHSIATSSGIIKDDVP